MSAVLGKAERKGVFPLHLPPGFHDWVIDGIPSSGPTAEYAIRVKKGYFIKRGKDGSLSFHPKEIIIKGKGANDEKTD